LGKTYSTPKLAYQARFENERRWLTFDILCGRFTEDHKLWKHFKKSGIAKEDLNFFIENPCVPDIFGYNHYLTSERFLDERLDLYPAHTHGGNRRHKYADVESIRVEMEEESGLKVLLKEAWARYKKPIAITEVHLHCHREEQLRWFKQVWEIANELNKEKIDIRAVTTWAMLGSFGWNKLLTQPKGDYEPGAFDVRNGKLRPTALANFIKEINEHKTVAHPLSLEKGWWQRNSRILYSPVIKQVRLNKISNTAPILIIGKNGTLGKAFAKICDERYLSYKLLGRTDCDLRQPEQIEKAINLYKPWAIINAAGYVRVDDAENDIENCFRDNTIGAHNLAVCCKQAGIQLISFSTDLVFDGQKTTPYIESDIVHPLNIYGKSKEASERLILNSYSQALVIRTSAFFGPWDEYNFVHYVRKNLLQDEQINVANDLVISPTYVPDLVNSTLDILIDKESGIWHLANKGSITWANLAFEIADGFGLDKSLINPISANEMNFAAKRPGNTVLSSERGVLLPTLENALRRYMHEQKREKRKVA
ncbi:MAG TPA: dTDP-4-dehydrorhamnose reductase, partial [Flavisolibacter sp.]|nr:dTDP-4-dehydrorhamnose reductase [Flavisolibacter sp.]